MMTIIISIAALISLAAWIFKAFFEDVCEWWDKILEDIIETGEQIVSSLKTFLRRGEVICARLWKKYMDGSYAVVENTTNNISGPDIPLHIKKALDQSGEAIIEVAS